MTLDTQSPHEHETDIVATDPSVSGSPQETETEETMAEKAETKRKRLRLFGGFAVILLLIGASVFAYDKLVASKYVSTNNAYVGASVAPVNPEITGIVSAVAVNDTKQVKAGDILVRLDDTDARLALAAAQADLDKAERRVRGYIANDAGLAAQVSALAADQRRAGADIQAAQANVRKAQIDLDRRTALVASGSVSADEVTSAQAALTVAQSSLSAARAGQSQASANRSAAVGSRQVNAALISGSNVADNPEVVAARVVRDMAQRDLDRTIIRAPVAGVVANSQIQIGQRVQPGDKLMIIVPVQKAYVDANFKESQLEKVRPGQKVELTSDLYGSDVTFNGRVAGFSGGTGSAFAIVPAQNATGNWIKVVQRLPVRIELDAKQLKEHPLRVGLSMEAEIHLAD